MRVAKKELGKAARFLGGAAFSANPIVTGNLDQRRKTRHFYRPLKFQEIGRGRAKRGAKCEAKPSCEAR